MRKLILLHAAVFVLAAVIVDFNGCWRPVTAALDVVGLHVFTDHDDIGVSFGHDRDDD